MVCMNLQYMQKMLNKYPIVNLDWEVGDSVYSLQYYIECYGRGRSIRGYNVSNYAGICNYFVRKSKYDDVVYKFDRNNDPWNRRFFAYKSGSRINKSNQYICRPLIGGSGDILMYVMTTSVEGDIVYCLDVIECNNF
jgi:hypothetical protein